MFGTVYKSYSGLLSSSQALSVSSNNLSNLNTIGFKKSSSDFHQLMSSYLEGSSGNGNPIQLGLGANVSAINQHFNQGSVQETHINTNIALLGEGFFVTSRGGTTEYTRAGNFRFNGNGELMAPDSSLVQGYTTRNADGGIDTTSELGNIAVDYDEQSPARASQIMRFITNLSATAEPGENYATVIDVWDETGTSHPLRLTFTKSDEEGAWSYQFSSSEDVALDAESTGTLTFDEVGALETFDGTPIAELGTKTITLSGLPNEASDLPLEWELVNTTNPASPTNNLTNYSSFSNTGTQYQDGFGSGDLQTVSFRQDGTLIGFYSNGENVELARIGIAHFNNVNGLKQSSGSFFRESATSGEAVLRPDGSTSVLGNSVENSNVDVAEELVNLIVHQRSYQGNSKAISMADQVIQEVLGLAR